MQEARFAAGLIAALLLAGSASAGPLGVVSDLPFETVKSYLRDAGVDRAWAIQQYAPGNNGDLRTIDAWSGRRPAAKHSCASVLTEINLRDRDGRLSLESSTTEDEYAFVPCDRADTNAFHSVQGKFDLAQLESDFDSVLAAANGAPGNAKLSIRDEDMRGAFGQLRSNDLIEIQFGKDGRSRLCFVTAQRDQLGAIETLSAEVVPGEPPRVEVSQCGYLEMMAIGERKK